MFVVVTTPQRHSTYPEFRFCTGSNLARGMSEIRDDDDDENLTPFVGQPYHKK